MIISPKIMSALFCVCSGLIMANPSEISSYPYNHEGECFYVTEAAKNKEKKESNLKLDKAKQLSDSSHTQFLHDLLVSNYKKNVANRDDDVSFMDAIFKQISSQEELNYLFSALIAYKDAGDKEFAEYYKIKIITLFFYHRYSINKDTIYEGICYAFSNKEYSLANCLLVNCKNLSDTFMFVLEHQLLKGDFDVDALDCILCTVSLQDDINQILFKVCSYKPPKFNTVCCKCLENYKIELVKALVSYHAEFVSELTESIAYAAAFNGEYKLMFYLLDNGANVNYITKGGETVLSHIIMHESEKQCEIICEQLLTYPVKLNVGKPLPMYAARYLKYEKVVDMLNKYEQRTVSK